MYLPDNQLYSIQTSRRQSKNQAHATTYLISITEDGMIEISTKHEQHHGIYYHGNNMAYQLTFSLTTQNIASHLNHNMAYQIMA